MHVRRMLLDRVDDSQDQSRVTGAERPKDLVELKGTRCLGFGRPARACGLLLVFLTRAAGDVIHSVPDSLGPVAVWLPDGLQWANRGFTFVCTLWGEVCVYEPVGLIAEDDRFFVPDTLGECLPVTVRGQWSVWQIACSVELQEVSLTASSGPSPGPEPFPGTEPLPEPIPEPQLWGIVAAAATLAALGDRRHIHSAQRCQPERRAKRGR